MPLRLVTELTRSRMISWTLGSESSQRIAAEVEGGSKLSRKASTRWAKSSSTRIDTTFFTVVVV